MRSPLRYPGSKYKIRKTVGRVVNSYGISSDSDFVLVEPFAGGASISLHVLSEGLADGVVISDCDALVYSFWKTVFEDTEWFLEQIRNMEIDLEKWNSFREQTPTTIRDKAIKCLFLNRTSYSGILSKSAGPLGGQQQESDYKIDCRFYRDTLIDRVEKISSFCDSIFGLYQKDWQDVIDVVLEKYSSDQLFFYFDPPFYHEADRLYRHYFSENDHIIFRNVLLELNSPWILSYDYSKFIVDLYKDVQALEIDVIYTSNTRKGKKELLLTNCPALLTEPREELAIGHS